MQYWAPVLLCLSVTKWFLLLLLFSHICIRVFPVTDNPSFKVWIVIEVYSFKIKGRRKVDTEKSILITSVVILLCPFGYKKGIFKWILLGNKEIKTQKVASNFPRNKGTNRSTHTPAYASHGFLLQRKSFFWLTRIPWKQTYLL